MSGTAEDYCWKRQGMTSSEMKGNVRNWQEWEMDRKMLSCNDEAAAMTKLGDTGQYSR